MTVAERGHELPCDRWRWSVGSVLSLGQMNTEQAGLCRAIYQALKGHSLNI